MSWVTMLRDGEAFGAGFTQRMIALRNFPSVSKGSGYGTGYSAGAVGGALHFFDTQTALNALLAPGWAVIVIDAGGSTYAQRSIYVETPSNNGVSLGTNSQGSTRVDTICLRVDQSIAPDANGTNIASIFVVAGGMAGAVGNAPADGALYLPLYLASIPNGSTTVTLTDVRSIERTPTTIYRTPDKARMYLNSAANLANGSEAIIPLDTKDYDPGVIANTSTHQITIATPGYYQLNWRLAFAAAPGTSAGEMLSSVFKNGSVWRRGARHGLQTTSGGGLPGTAVGLLVAGDIIELHGYQTTGGAFAIQTGSIDTFLDIHLLSGQ